MADIKKVDLASLPQMDQDKFKVILKSAGLVGFSVLVAQKFKGNPGFLQQNNDLQNGNTFFGTPVFSNIVFQSGSYKKNDGSTVKYKEVVLDTVLMDISMQKMIVKTPVQGRNGTVKEYISNGDYSINIRGGIFNKDPDSYPTSQVNDLITICNVPNDLQITSWFLQMFSIFNIVIESFDFVQQEGFQSCQLFNFQCVSDEPIELKKSEI